MVMAMVAVGRAACGGGALVRDWGLRRSWRIERDCMHPERPAILLEIPWTLPERGNRAGEGPSRAVSSTAPDVHAGMRVVMTRQDENGEIHLVGTALGTGHAGERVAVRTGSRGTILRGIVRGPGRVELDSVKGGR